MTDLYTRGEAEPAVELHYDDASAAEAEKKKSSSLLSRIGRSRVYALEDTSASMLGRLAKVGTCKETTVKGLMIMFDF